mmetsp:Transcript_25690/g.65260  ORF Transcript_25690/g.65260 Transcript_25690/m.65260 type:complete len:239 (-) Transcript_25690:339-1055(-)
MVECTIRCVALRHGRGIRGPSHRLARVPHVVAGRLRRRDRRRCGCGNGRRPVGVHGHWRRRATVRPVGPRHSRQQPIRQLHGRRRLRRLLLGLRLGQLRQAGRQALHLQHLRALVGPTCGRRHLLLYAAQDAVGRVVGGRQLALDRAKVAARHLDGVDQRGARGGRRLARPRVQQVHACHHRVRRQDGVHRRPLLGRRVQAIAHQLLQLARVGGRHGRVRSLQHLVPQLVHGARLKGD